ncbi:DNA-directed RNA polymerases I, II, and III subunit RPABC5 [Smittium mucronatum]|uniref:DNA-directed RNA polymerases I, II, and III subunit RPABC5 n=1 Tax=Smittium mucronatum TaxID=133383 RepID=A0A1R0H415_9FUNG|nr:DNA-directed RNA polymerases I, II, and III subunit RPABC5 [Smittium mucronatum]
MIIPVVCFTCGKVIGNRWDAYLILLQMDVSEGEALTALGLNRSSVGILRESKRQRYQKICHQPDPEPPLNPQSGTRNRALYRGSAHPVNASSTQHCPATTMPYNQPRTISVPLASTATGNSAGPPSCPRSV